MKKFLTLLLIMSSVICYSQNASNYFPSSTGYKWYYKNTPLDSLNNPVPGTATYQVDSFAAVTNHQGLVASKILSKTGLSSINQISPYLDTNYFNFQSTNAWYYLNILSLIGSIPIIDSIAFVNFLRSFEAWYNTYRFSQSVNTNYTIFSKDTTLNADTLSLPLRIASTGRRLNDQNVSTVNGNYTAKKFLMTFTISYGVLPPFIYIPIVTQPDTIYFAESVWKIKEVRPSVNIDLTSVGFPVAFTIPGTLTELTQAPSGITNYSNSISGSYQLDQNFPNPFNPVTRIRYSIPENSSNVRLVIYDQLGNEIRTLVNKKQNAGNYEAEFNGSGLASGVYYYKLVSKNFSDIKSMILLK